MWYRFMFTFIWLNVNTSVHAEVQLYIKGSIHFMIVGSLLAFCHHYHKYVFLSEVAEAQFRNLHLSQNAKNLLKRGTYIILS
jgi:hypothetical protein